MIISRAEINSAVSAYRAVKGGAGAATTTKADSFERSPTAESLFGFAQTASEPFYRPSLVDDLGRRISEGRYHVPSEEIVDKMLGRLIVEFAQAG